jgi:hypothetical protein
MIEDMKVRILSAKTIAIYVQAVAKFSEFFHKSPGLMGPEEVRTYQAHLVHQKKVSWSAFNIAVSALKFLYAVTLAKDWVVQKIPYARKPSQGASPLEIPPRPIEWLDSRHSLARGDSRSQEPGVRSQKKNPELPLNRN